jgi:hypothetical protein
MVRNAVKKLRSEILDLVWSVGGTVRPGSSQEYQVWQLNNTGSQKTVLREPFSETIPAIPFAGNQQAIAPAMAGLSHGLRAGYYADFDVPSTLSFGQDYIVTIPNGRMLSSLGIVISPDNVHFQDLSGGSFRGLAHHPLYYDGMYVPPVKRLRGTAVVLATGLGQRNYYHWTAEILPRLRLLEQAGVRPDFYCIPKRHHYHYESLELMGIPRERLVTLGKYTHLQADNLLVPSVNRQEMTRENAQYLYQKIAVPHGGNSKVQTSAKIYIARRRRHWRSIQNESRLMDRLSKLGFQRYYLEDMSMLEQVQLFYHADTVVGPHGSGLVNLVYCKPGTRVVEIGTPVRPSGLFHRIAHHRGLCYKNFIGIACNTRADESNILCDENELIALLREMD